MARFALVTVQLLVVLATIFIQLLAGVPIQDSPRQYLLDGTQLPLKYSKKASPYTPKHRDPYDSAIDSVGGKLDPLPWRNGFGALRAWSVEPR
jgi:hypothetical protein